MFWFLAYLSLSSIVSTIDDETVYARFLLEQSLAKNMKNEYQHPLDLQKIMIQNKIADYTTCPKKN